MLCLYHRDHPEYLVLLGPQGKIAMFLVLRGHQDLQDPLEKTQRLALLMDRQIIQG